MSNFSYGELNKGNKNMSFIFFACFVILFYLVLLNMFLTIVISIYDQLRKKKALDSMARAKILSREQINIFTRWVDLFLCRMPPDQDI